MKKSNSIIAIIALAIVAIAAAFVSCKKETEKALNQKDYSLQQAADIRQMDDPRSYMIDFKKKLMESKSAEAYNLDDAAWHLACLANLDFCKVNVEYNDVQFDTVEMQVIVTDGIVLLSDLNAAYQQMCNEIQQFKRGFNHENQDLYYINVSISTDGTAKIALMTSFNNSSKDPWDHTWYYVDIWFEALACDSIYSEWYYSWDDTAPSELQRILNCYDHHENDSSDMNHIQICYFPTRNHDFDYNNTSDPYQSYFYNNSRVFAYRDQHASFIHYLELGEEMCYCLDSYLGLGYDFINDNLYADEHPVSWTIRYGTEHPDKIWYYHYHQLHVEYGRLIAASQPGND
ncbi:MAG: hypothetical protein K6G25_10995 [Bacteroidales bacterium]|nr:hypothetical protein [Bacteroidales bacterium]